MTQKLVPLVGGALAVALIGLAGGYFGATLAESPDAPRSAGGDALTGLRKDIQELDRRLEKIEVDLVRIDDSATTALDRVPDIDALLRRVSALEQGRAGGDPILRGAGGPVAAAPATEGGEPVPATGPERDRIDEERRQELIRKSREIFTANARKFLPFELNMLKDATKDGEAARRSQVYGRSRRMAVQYSLTPAKEQELRKLLQDEMESAVREVGPYLKGGLKSADFSQVKAKLTGLWSSTDAGMQGILDPEQYREYEADAKNRREVYSKILDEWEDERLSRR